MVDPSALFAIPMDDITVAHDSANTAPSDPIVLGAKAEAALKRLAEAFEIARLPRTMAELKAMWRYCWFLSAHRPDSPDSATRSADDEALWRRVQLRTAVKHAPEFVEVVVALQEGNREALRAVNAHRLTLEHLATRLNEEGDLIIAPLP